jgi:hypothetical protein
MLCRGQYVQVEGNPFFMLGGQVNNSSAYTAERMVPLWGLLRRMHANTAEVPVYWEQFEPEEGVYDTTMVDALLAGAREHGLRLVILWFASWKNGTMKYSPAWVKLQPERFHRVLTPEGNPLPVLSPHCPANLEADCRAFRALMAHLAEVDRCEHTVIMVQVENEPGSNGTERDFSPEASAYYALRVPQALLDALPQATRAVLRQAWAENGCRTAGTWGEVFGSRGAEVFSAWSVARYIDQVAEAGKRIYDLPMYVNVWMREGGFRVAGYDYPSGGAVETMLDVWKAAAPHIDLIAPDTYAAESGLIRAAFAAYDRQDNALLIPECALAEHMARHMFYAVADHGAIGVAPFGIDKLTDERGEIRPCAVAFVQSFQALEAVLPLLPRYQGTGCIHAIVQEENATEQFVALDGYDALVQFGKGYFHMPLTAVAPGAERGRGLLIQTGPKEFYATGIGFTVYLRPQQGQDRLLHRNNWAGRFDPYLVVEAGHFEGDTWRVEERRSGDESDFGLVCWRPGQAIHATLE